MRIERIVDAAVVALGAELFDDLPQEAATARFLRSPAHHLLFAFEDDGRPVGMVTGVETTHPDKGTEMFLYELGVDPLARGKGVATALVNALVSLAQQRGCYGMWVGTDADNAAALATYRRTGAGEPEASLTLSWDFTAPAT